MPGHSPSKTGVNALMAGHPRLASPSERKAWMAGTSPAITGVGKSLHLPLHHALAIKEIYPGRDDDRDAGERPMVRHVGEDEIAERDHPDDLGVDEWRQHGSRREAVRDDQQIMSEPAEQAHRAHQQDDFRVALAGPDKRHPDAGTGRAHEIGIEIPRLVPVGAPHDSDS